MGKKYAGTTPVYVNGKWQQQQKTVKLMLWQYFKSAIKSENNAILSCASLAQYLKTVFFFIFIAYQALLSQKIKENVISNDMSPLKKIWLNTAWKKLNQITAMRKLIENDLKLLVK